MANYPLFCGNVVGVPAIIFDDTGVVTVVDYLPPQKEEQLADLLDRIQAMAPERREKAKEDLAQKCKRVVIPMHLDPSVIEGCEIRARYAEMCDQGYGDGKTFKTYEIEVISGRPIPIIGILAGMADMGGPRHRGFKYIKVLKEMEP